MHTAYYQQAAERRPAASASSRPDATSVEGLVSIVLQSLVLRRLYLPETADWRASDLQLFTKFLERGHGVTSPAEVGREHVLEFLGARRSDGARPSSGRSRIRLIAIRVFFREAVTLGLVSTDPTLGIPLPPKDSIHARPLTDPEVAVGRSHALPSLGDLRRSIAWPLTEATGRTSEIGLVRARDVDDGGRVWLPGSSTTDARWGQLTEWGIAQIERRLRTVQHPDEALIVWRTPPRALRAAASQALTETLKTAGLHGPGVRPRSIVAWAGRRALDDGMPIDEVARLLGMRSLDETAQFIGHDWRREGM